MKRTAPADKPASPRIGLLLTAALAAAMSFAACDRATEPAFDEFAQETITIAGLKSLCDRRNVTLSRPVAVRGYVTGNNRFGEFPRALVIQDASGGITVRADYPAAGNPYPLGTELVVYCNSLTLYDYGGKIELGKITDDDFPGDAGENRCIPRTELDLHLRPTGGEPARPAAVPITLDRLSAEYIDTYVRLDDVRFTVPGSWCDIDSETGRSKTTERTLTDRKERTIAVRTAGGCTYANEPLPEGSGSLCGILDYFNEAYSLRITGFETRFVNLEAHPTASL